MSEEGLGWTLRYLLTRLGGRCIFKEDPGVSRKGEKSGEYYVSELNKNTCPEKGTDQKFQMLLRGQVR